MGITLGLAAGGMLWGKGLFIAQFGSVMADDAVPSKSDGAVATNPKTRPPWEIYVNTAGERFVREDEPNNGIREEALTAQVGHRYWIVFDQNAFDKAPPLMPRWEAPRFAAAFNSHPMFAKGRTLNELAVRAGVDPQGLARSVEGYNAALAGQKGDPMGRAHRPAPIARGPFYAIRLQGTTPTSTVGIAINDEFKVVTAAGAPIPGLYAIGEVIGNGATAGNALVGGSLITPALTFGRLLGEKMLPVGA
jgi:fumarate reductase flavoprotein subunit